MEEGSQTHHVCGSCGAPLIEIDRYGEPLEGCLQCNRWKSRGSERVLIELPDEDVTALRELKVSEREHREV